MVKSVQRRLAAIVSVDVVGYSRLMGADEAGTLAALHAHRAVLIDAKIAEHGGRIVKTMGDGLLLEFPSVVEATQCAIEVQQGIAERNEGVDEGKRIIFRIGVNLGDIIIEGEDILGDGVNIAARLQELAEPGGVTIASRVHDDVRDRLEVVFADTGEQSLKNIAHPMRVWQWTATTSTAAEPTTGDKLLPLPDKPSIAVLPFDNMSGDPEQEYFVDGLCEDIITILSKVSGLLLISRNSSFLYKGQRLNIRRIAGELGVRYILEGSVRKSGDRIRVTAQLIDATSDHHVWAERYDRQIDDVFEIQDEITKEIVTSLQVKLAEGEQARVWRRQAGDFSAYEYFARGRELYMNFDRESHVEAAIELGLALEQNSNFGAAHAYLGWVKASNARFGWCKDRIAELAEARQCGEKSIICADDPGLGYAVLASVNMYESHYDEAHEIAQKAVDSSPSNSECWHVLARCKLALGQWQEAVHAERHALRLNPLMPENALVDRALAYFHLADYENCVDDASRVLERQPTWLTARVLLAAAAAKQGLTESATAQVAQLLRDHPRFSVTKWAQFQYYKHDNDLQFYLSGLLDAGLPE